MKTVGKALIIAGSLLFSGMIITFIFFNIVIAQAKSQSGNGKSGNLEECYYEVEGSLIDKFTVSMIYEDIQIEPAERNNIEISYYDDPSDSLYRIVQNGDTLRMERKEMSSEGMVFSISDIAEVIADSYQDIDKKSTVVIRIPKEYMGTYDMGSASGNITLADVPATQNVNLSSTSGDIHIQNVECEGEIHMDSTSGSLMLENSSVAKSIYAGSTSGNSTFKQVETRMDLRVSLISGTISLSEVRADGDVKLNSTSGDVKISNVVVTGDMDYESTSGSMSGFGLSVAQLYTDSTSGDVSLTGLTLGKGINGSSTSGTYSVSVLDKMDNYNIHVDTVSGYTNLPMDSQIGSDHYINISTTSGDITFTFDGATE